MTEASASAAGTAREETRPENRQRTEVKTATFIVILVKTEKSGKIFEIRCQKKSEAVVVLLGSREDGEEKAIDMGHSMGIYYIVEKLPLGVNSAVDSCSCKVTIIDHAFREYPVCSAFIFLFF